MKRIGIFTKMEMAGGSEFRACEMASAISQVPGCQSVLLAERSIADRLHPVIGKRVEVHDGVFSRPNVEVFYSLDHLLVINSDSRDFTTCAYWQGRSPRHSHCVDLARLKQVVFLFNFIVSPSTELPAIRALVPDVRIIAANGKFFEEISEKSRYEAIRHYPRLQLESPICPDVAQPKISSSRLRFGMHSLGARDKWNSQLPELVRVINGKYGDRVSWDFMGMPRSLGDSLCEPNVTVRREFAKPTTAFLQELDVFVFFRGWKREEAWARSAAEAMMSGCPVITTARGGNVHQVTHGNTGFLCKNLEDFIRSCARLIDSPETLAAMQANARRAALQFSSDTVVRRFLDFIQ